MLKFCWSHCFSDALNWPNNLTRNIFRVLESSQVHYLYVQKIPLHHDYSQASTEVPTALKSPCSSLPENAASEPSPPA